MTEQSPWGQAPQPNPYGQPPGAPYSAGPPPPPGGGYPAPGYGGPQDPGGPQGPKKSRTGLIIGIVVAAVVVLGLLAGGVALVANSDGESADDTSESPSAEPTEDETDEPTDEPTTEDPTDEPTDEPTEDEQTSDGTSMFGDGYDYDLPGEGWQDATDEARAIGAGGAIDTMSILGSSLAVAQSNILVEAGPSGGGSLADLEPLWKRNISGTDGAVPEAADGRRIDGEDTVGVRIERVNDNDQEITQVAYLVVHDDMQYSIALSFPKGDSVSEDDYATALDSWTWD